MSTTSAFRYVVGSLIATAVAACGGSQQAEPEAPSTTTQEPATNLSEGASPDDGSSTGSESTGSEGEGTHTMPDGTTMPGHHHGEGEPKSTQ